MSQSFFKSNDKEKNKISAVEILKYGNAVKRRYNYILSTLNYEVTRNIYLYLPSKPNFEIIGIDILAKHVFLRTDTIFDTIVISLEDENNMQVISPEQFIKKYAEGRVVLAAISDILLKYYESCLEFKSFKTDITKIKDIHGDLELEISPEGIFLCTQKKKDFSKYCSVLYEHYDSNNGNITTATDEEKKLLKSLYFYVEDCPEWIKNEHLKNLTYQRKSKKKILSILKRYLGGLNWWKLRQEKF